MAEDVFVDEALRVASDLLRPPLSIRRGAALLYQVTVNNRLELTVDPKQPVRGQSAFQTDLCVFENLGNGIEIPRVVMEFKPNVSTHDVLTYSTKARRHKQVYAYVRYGLVVGNIDRIPGRFFAHNEGLDFCVAASAHKGDRLTNLLASLLKQEVAASKRLEKVIFGRKEVYIFREDVVFEARGL